MSELLQYIIQPGVISILLPLAIKGIKSLIADVRFARRKVSQQLLVGIPVNYHSDYLHQYPTVCKLRDASNLDSKIVFFRYSNISVALRKCDYVLVDQVHLTDPRIINDRMLRDLINAYSNVRAVDRDDQVSLKSEESATDSHDVS